MTQSERVAAARGNIIETYFGLAETLPDITINRSQEVQYVLSPEDLSLGNFALGFNLDPEDEMFESKVDLVVQAAASRSSFRVYVLTGDRPADLRRSLMQHGLVRSGTLVQMWADTRACDRSPELAETALERKNVTDFMVKVFFPSRNSSLARKVSVATSASKHQVACLQFGGKIVAAAMLSRSQGCIGLYNVCVDRRHRGKGIGTDLVERLIGLAHQSSSGVTLQCEASLAPWYAKLGFENIGHVESFRSISRNI